LKGENFANKFDTDKQGFDTHWIKTKRLGGKGLDPGNEQISLDNSSYDEYCELPGEFWEHGLTIFS
jgi:hypothetical protein